MKKRYIITIALILVIALASLFYLELIQPRITGKTLDYYTQTKAICDESNYCQDFQVSCNSDGVVMTTPITGAAVQHNISWQDPRNETERELCN